MISTLYFVTDNAEPSTFNTGSTCLQTTCLHSETEFTNPSATSVDDFEFPSSPGAVLTQHGITLLTSSEETSKIYGSVMNHAGFFVESVPQEDHVLHYSGAIGDLTQSHPSSGSATWTGLIYQAISLISIVFLADQQVVV